MFLLIYFFMKNAERFYHSPGEQTLLFLLHLLYNVHSPQSTLQYNSKISCSCLNGAGKLARQEVGSCSLGAATNCVTAPCKPAPVVVVYGISHGTMSGELDFSNTPMKAAKEFLNRSWTP
jgi:hypothetical protein